MRPSLPLIRIISLSLFAATLSGAPAAAQGLFDSLFGGATERQGLSHRYVPRQATAYSDPYNSPSSDQRYGASPSPDQRYSTPSSSDGGTGRYLAYCVRLCDGRHFPMQRHGNATSIQLCSAFCPAAKTQVFNGSGIDHAVASSGARYADLDNAFVYREKIVTGCTCNGKDAFGLAKIDIASDPTLRPGDIVASGDNVKAALIAAAAAKERVTAREAANERPALRGSASRRVASRPGAIAPAEADERPED